MRTLIAKNGKMISCFKTTNYEHLIEKLYSNETDDWHKKVHKNKGTLESNIKSTIATINDNYDVYVVSVDDEQVAFFAIYKNEIPILDGFHIAKEFRDKWFFEIFWQFIKDKFFGLIYTSLYSQNNDAIKHLKKQGFKELKTTIHLGRKIVTLLLKY